MRTPQAGTADGTKRKPPSQHPMLGLPADATQLIRSATLASSTNGDPRWYVHVSGENFGPYGRSDIERMIQNRQLQAQDYLCPEGGAEWIEARKDPTFGHLLSEPVDFAAILPDRPAKKSAADVKVYHAKSGAQLRLALLAFVGLVRIGVAEADF